MGIRHNNLTVNDIQERISQSKFHQLYSPKVLEVNNTSAILKLRVSMSEYFERQPDTGHWHGGVLASLVDISGCYALMLVAKGQILTLNFSTDFLKLAISKYVYATASVRKVGRTVGFVDVNITNDEGITITTGRACYAIQSDNDKT